MEKQRYFLRRNDDNLRVYVSQELRNQPENSLPFEPNDFFISAFDQFPNPTAIVEDATDEEIAEILKARNQIEE